MTSVGSMSTVWTVTPRSAAIARQVETLASWSRRRHDDLVTRLEGRPDRSAEMERERRHVRAELDLVRRGGTEQVGYRGVGLVGHRVGPPARGERTAGVRVRVAEVARDRVDHPLRDLGAARPVEEDGRPAVVLTGEGRELRPDSVDIEREHRDSCGVGGHRGYRSRCGSTGQDEGVPGGSPRPPDPTRYGSRPNHIADMPAPTTTSSRPAATSAKVTSWLSSV